MKKEIYVVSRLIDMDKFILKSFDTKEESDKYVKEKIEFTNLIQDPVAPYYISEKIILEIKTEFNEQQEILRNYIVEHLSRHNLYEILTMLSEGLIDERDAFHAYYDLEDDKLLQVFNSLGDYI